MEQFLRGTAPPVPGGVVVEVVRASEPARLGESSPAAVGVARVRIAFTPSPGSRAAAPLAERPARPVVPAIAAATPERAPFVARSAPTFRLPEIAAAGRRPVSPAATGAITKSPSPAPITAELLARPASESTLALSVALAATARRSARATAPALPLAVTAEFAAVGVVALARPTGAAVVAPATGRPAAAAPAAATREPGFAPAA
jgi:hypothetical protein